MVDKKAYLIGAVFSAFILVGGIGLSMQNNPVTNQAAQAIHTGGMMDQMGDPGPTIVTHHDEFINFADPTYAQGPVIQSVRDGKWSSASTWSSGRIPAANQVVQIKHDVELDSSTVDINTIGVYPGGHLSFATNRSITLKLVNFLVWSGGELTIGDQNDFVDGNIEVIFKDVAIDTSIDPNMLGNGLVVLGKVSMHGLAKNKTWFELSTEPKKGDTTLTLESVPNGWTVGSQIVIPDTRQVLPPDVGAFTKYAGRLEGGYQWEERTIKSISGNKITLNTPLSYDHFGARRANGSLELLPHVALLDRTVTFRSENPNGTRGHFMGVGRAEVDVRYAAFVDMGRTRNDVLISPSNPLARYPLHMHHVIGPVNNSNTGHQFTLVGNTVSGGLKWGLVVHGSSFGLIKDNVVYDLQGSGIVTEDGTEFGNDILDNIAIRIFGTGYDGNAGTNGFANGDFGRGGVGFWFRRAGNNIEGNVAANTLFAGFLYNNYFSNKAQDYVPAFRGADVQVVENRMSLNTIPEIGTFRDNTAYALMKFGFHAAYHYGFRHTGKAPEFILEDMKIWHINNEAISPWHVTNIKVDSAMLLADKKAFDNLDRRSEWQRQYPPTALGFHGAYDVIDFWIRDSVVENFLIGFEPAVRDGSPKNIEHTARVFDSTFENYTNVRILPSLTSHGKNSTRHVVLSNTKLKLLDVPNVPSSNNQHALIDVSYDIYNNGHINPMNLSVVDVYKHNGDRDENFRVYMPEAAPEYVPKPSRLPHYFGSPEDGLTNAQLWNKYGVAVGGAVAACGDTTTGVLGFTCPIDARFAPVPPNPAPIPAPLPEPPPPPPEDDPTAEEELANDPTLPPTIPDTPQNLKGTAQAMTHVSLSWDRADASLKVKEYKVYRNGVVIETTDTNTYEEYLEASNANTIYTVRYVYRDGTISDDSNTFTVSPVASNNTSQSSIPPFTQVRALGDSGEDIRQLQIFLSSQGFIVANSGSGAPGNESTFFGQKTADALKRFQEEYAAEILTPLNLSLGTGNLGVSTIAKINQLLTR
ncbi:MAG: hypothetical protein ACI9VM_000238 [Candidatus Azotimanducaceae bacterium]|jgi:hypothetical protein